MRRIVLLLGLLVAAAAPFVAVLPARAVTASCARPAAVSTLGHVGLSYSVDTAVDTSDRSDSAKVCVDGWTGLRYEVSAGQQTYRYATDGMGGGWVGVCDGYGSGKECTTAGVLWNGGVWTSPDVAAMALTPSVCQSSASASYEHCWMVPGGGYVDGPLGSSSGAGAGACVAEVNEFGYYCIVKVPPTIPAP